MLYLCVYMEMNFQGTVYEELARLLLGIILPAYINEKTVCILLSL